MMALDDLINKLPLTLELGNPVASRNQSTYLPLWEALLGDPLSDIFRKELLYKTKNNFPDVRITKELNILEIATGTGLVLFNCWKN